MNLTLCPRCGFPLKVEANIYMERDVKCSSCDWSGASSALIVADESRFKDPEVFAKLYEALAKEGSPVLGAILLRLGIVTRPTTPQELRVFATLLRDVTGVVFKELLRQILGGTINA